MRGHRVRRCAAVLAALLPVGAAGCTFFGEQFDPQGDEARAARAAATADVEERLTRVVGDATAYGRLFADACHEGQENWKVREPLAWDCRVGVATVVDGARTRDDVVAALADLHRRVVDAGCTPREGEGLLGQPTQYWQELSSREGYGPQDLPSVVYECGSDAWVEVLSSAPGAEALVRDVADPFGIGFPADRVIAEEGLPASGLTAVTAAEAAQVFVVRVTQRYYSVPS